MHTEISEKDLFGNGNQSMPLEEATQIFADKYSGMLASILFRDAPPQLNHLFQRTREELQNEKRELALKYMASAMYEIYRVAIKQKVIIEGGLLEIETLCKTFIFYASHLDQISAELQDHDLGQEVVLSYRGNSRKYLFWENPQNCSKSVH